MPPTIALPTICSTWVREVVKGVVRESLIKGLSTADVAQAQGSIVRFVAAVNGLRRARHAGAILALGGDAEPGRGRSAPDQAPRLGVDRELVEQRLDPAHALGDLRAAARQEAVAAELERLGAEDL